MNTVDVPFGNAIIKLQCEDPEKILSLAQSVNIRMDAIKDSYGPLHDSRALFIASLLMQDEIENLSQQRDRATSDSAEAQSMRATNEYLIDIIEHVAEYLERLEEKLKARVDC